MCQAYHNVIGLNMVPASVTDEEDVYDGFETAA